MRTHFRGQFKKDGTYYYVIGMTANAIVLSRKRADKEIRAHVTDRRFNIRHINGFVWECALGLGAGRSVIFAGKKPNPTGSLEDLDVSFFSQTLEEVKHDTNETFVTNLKKELSFDTFTKLALDIRGRTLYVYPRMVSDNEVMLSVNPYAVIAPNINSSPVSTAGILRRLKEVLEDKHKMAEASGIGHGQMGIRFVICPETKSFLQSNFGAPVNRLDFMNAVLQACGEKIKERDVKKSDGVTADGTRLMFNKRDENLAKQIEKKKQKYRYATRRYFTGFVGEQKYFLRYDDKKWIASLHRVDVGSKYAMSTLMTSMQINIETKTGVSGFEGVASQYEALEEACLRGIHCEILHHLIPNNGKKD